MLTALFAFTLLISPYAWIGALASAAFICFVLESESSIILTISTIFLVLFGAIALNLTSLESLSAHPMLIPAFLAGYVAVGAVWVWFAWASYLSLVRERYDDRGDEFDALPADSNWKREWQDAPKRVQVPLTGEALAEARVKYIAFGFNFAIPPQVREHKARIVCYMAYWPFSMIRTLLNDPFRRLWNALYRMYHGRLQAMSDRAFNRPA